MVERTYSATLLGLEAVKIEVEVDGAVGTPNLILVGLPSRAVDEAKDRITSAIQNSGIRIRSKRTIVNLAPANIKKSDSTLELAITIAILKMYGEITADTDQTMFFGELSLDGSIKAINGCLALVTAAKKLGFKTAIVPSDNRKEASYIEGIHIISAAHITEVIAHCNQDTIIQPTKNHVYQSRVPEGMLDIKSVRGQNYAKRALEIAAAGGHNIFLTGPPGAGKSMMAKTLIGLLPPLSKSEAIETTNIFSIIGDIPETGLLQTRPFRAPHHSTSLVGLIGGGSMIKPGEISLAHRGVLFLDEFPEFSRSSIEALRQPLEEGEIKISRAIGNATYPARFILVAAANPCPCGNALSTTKLCHCSPMTKLRYQQRISGPILDRIDLHVAVQPVKVSALVEKDNHAETSATIRKRVIAARSIQKARWQAYKLQLNGEVTSASLISTCKLRTEAKQLLAQATQKLQLSARSYFKVIKISQTIADLVQAPIITREHIAEALQYRPML